MSQDQPVWENASGVQYAIRILFGATIAWVVLRDFLGRDALWAMISVVVVSEPRLDSALLAFKSRIANTLIGSAIGLVFLLLLGPAAWSILLAMTASVLLCTYVIRLPLSWKIAPITVAIVMTPSIVEKSRAVGVQTALWRTVEVLFGSAVAVLVSWLVDRLSRREPKP